MSGAFSLGLIAITLTAFFGLGGVTKAEALYSDFKGKSKGKSVFTKKPTGISKGTTQEKIVKSNGKAPIITTAVRRTNLEIADIKKLDQRKERSRFRFLKKSSKQIVEDKKNEEVKAKNVLKSNGATFSGIGKFGKQKLNANPNFDLGLPSTATREERVKVQRDKVLRNAKRRAQARKQQREKNTQLTLEGKSQSELQQIARDRGLNIHGNLSAKSLSRILERVK